MLVSSKNKNEKIVLGLLSYTFNASTLTNEQLQQYLQQIREDTQMDCYLYKTNEQENYIGILVVEFDQTQADSQTIVIHRLGLTPSFRNENHGLAMYREFVERFPHAAILPGVEVMDIIGKWNVRLNQE